MAQTDMPIEQLRDYRSSVTPAADLKEFWGALLTRADELAAPTTTKELESTLTCLRVYDLEFSGAHGHRVKGWLLLPRDAEEPMPCVVKYIGYGGGRSLPHEFTLWPSTGVAIAIMDTRSQTWSDTVDPGVNLAPQSPGFVTQGITAAANHYYSRVFVDAARLVTCVQQLPQIDSSRVAISGGSQGGAIAIAAAALTAGLAPEALRPEPLLGALVDVPFWCDVYRASTMVDTAPYVELSNYLRARPHDIDAVRETLSYLDGSVLAAHAECPSLFGVALMDDVCPPSTVYSAYNAWLGPKQIEVYPFGDHNGGDSWHQLVELEWLHHKFRG
jgi:cephalosporin-C deacetylase